MKFEAIVKDLIEELHTSSSATTSGEPSGRSSAGSSGRTTDALVATGTELVMQVVAQVAESVERMRAGSDPSSAPGPEAAEKPAPNRSTSEIEALVRRVVTQARELASQDRADLVRQLARPDLLLSGRGRAPGAADTVRGRVEL